MDAASPLPVKWRESPVYKSTSQDFSTVMSLPHRVFGKLQSSQRSKLPTLMARPSSPFLAHTFLKQLHKEEMCRDANGRGDAGFPWEGEENHSPL
jgi:hypothetical protein